MKKWQWVLLILFAFAVAAGFLEVFPDPYYHQGNVNFYVWAWRELDEIIHGEK